MMMLRIFLRNETRINLRKCIFLQTERTYSEKGITKKFIQKGKSSGGLTLKNVKNNIESIKNVLIPYQDDNEMVPWIDRPPDIPLHADVVIIGGGVIGSSVAYWLKKRVFKDMKVVVVEKDPTYTKASTVLSVGGLRQQFSLEENIEMSLYGAEFIRNINDYLGIDGESPIDPYFHPYGYLMLASEKGAEQLINNSGLQNFLGAKNVLLTAVKLQHMFPWLNTKDIALGCLGLEKEGWFDPWSLLCAFKKKALVLGAEYVYAEAKAFTYKYWNQGPFEKLDQLVIETPEGETKVITFALAVIAAGSSSGQIANLVKFDTAEGVKNIFLPVEPRKRYVYCFHCPEGPGLNTPLTIDYTGTYFRREGLAGAYICGKSPHESEEPSVEDLSVDHDYFYEKIWPKLANRVKAFEKLKVKSAWAGYYEYNTFDQNGIIGTHPYHRNLFFATGFSGHGIQQAPAVGRAISELIVDGKYMTIDLSNFSFRRIIKDEPVYETNII